MAYTGFILLEHHHANPVMQCFVRILLEVKGKPFLKDNSDHSNLFLFSNYVNPENYPYNSIPFTKLFLFIQDKSQNINEEPLCYFTYCPLSRFIA